MSIDDTTPRIASSRCWLVIDVFAHSIASLNALNVSAHLGSLYEKNLKVFVEVSFVAPAPYAPPFSRMAVCKKPFLKTAAKTERAAESGLSLDTPWKASAQ